MMLVTAALLFLAACSGDGMHQVAGQGAGVRLVWPGSGRYSDALPQPVGKPLVFQELLVCARPAGEVHVLGVRAANPRQGFVVTGWGYFSSWKPGAPSRPSIYESTLRTAGFRGGPVRLRSSCPDARGDGGDMPLTFAIEAHRQTARSAYTVGVIVDYESGGQTRSVTIPATFGICSEADRVKPADSPC